MLALVSQFPHLLLLDSEQGRENQLQFICVLQGLDRPPSLGGVDRACYIWLATLMTGSTADCLGVGEEQWVELIKRTKMGTILHTLAEF